MSEYTVPLVSPEVYQFANNDDPFYPPDGVAPFHPGSGVTGGADALDDSDDGTYAQFVMRSQRYGGATNAARWVLDGTDTQWDPSGLPTSGLIGGTVWLRVSWDGLAGQAKFLQVTGHDATNRAFIVSDGGEPRYQFGAVGTDGILGSPASGGPALVSIPFTAVAGPDGPVEDLSIIEQVAIWPTASRIPATISTVDEHYVVHEAWIVFQFDETEPPVTTIRVTRQFPRDDGYGASSASRIHPPPRRGRIVGGQE